MVVTDGIDLMPPAFVGGLEDWSSTDGTPGSVTYDGTANAAIVASDPDFRACLELQTISDPTSLRYMGEVPVIAGAYIEVKIRLKMMSGAFPSARIAAWLVVPAACISWVWMNSVRCRGWIPMGACTRFPR
jgi:hypothetical protein